MADFCYDCVVKLFGKGELNDFVGLAKAGETVCVLCEGCGYIEVDENGKKVKEKL